MKIKNKIIWSLFLVFSLILSTVVFATTSPSVQIQPSNPNTNENLNCNINNIGSYNSNSFLFHWYKNGAFQSSLSGWGDDQISSSNTQAGDIFKCEVFMPNPFPPYLPIPISGDNSDIVTIVDSNNPPTANNQNVETDEDIKLDITLTGSDPDLDPLTFEIISGSGPSNGILKGSGSTWKYSPNNNYNGPDSFKFKVNDGTVDSNEATVSITVNPVNDAPTANNQNVETDEDIKLDITLTGSDPDLDPLTFEIISGSGPSNGILKGSGSTWKYAPNNNYNGPDSFKFRVFDGTVFSSNDATVNINVNPINDAPVLNGIGNKQVNEGDLLEFIISATDVDGDSLTFSASNLPNGASFDHGTKVFSWTPTFNQAGTFNNVKFIVSDGQLTDEELITITVNNVPQNNPPVLDPIGNKQINEGQLLQFTISATDVDGNSLTFSASNLPNGASFNPATKTFSWTPNFNQAGTYNNLKFQVTDGSLEDSELITITVIDVPQNSAPTISGIPNQFVNEDEGFINNLVDLHLFASDPETPVNQLIYSILSQSNTNIIICSIDSNQFIDCQTQLNQNGFSDLRVRVKDPEGLTNTDKFRITVNPVNDAPVLNSIGNKQVNEGQLLQFTISGSDVDGDTLTFSASNLPIGANFDESTKEFTWTPDFNQANTYNDVEFKVSDGSLEDSELITITVNDVSINSPPEFSSCSLASNSILVNTQATVNYVVSDQDNDPLSISVNWGDNIITSGSATTASHTYTSTGTFNVVATANDGNGGSDSISCGSITVSSLPSNNPPVLDPIGNKQVNEGQLLLFIISGSDQDNDPLTFSASNLPQGAFFFPNTKTFFWIPNFNQAGQYQVTFTVSDGQSTDSETITISVNDVVISLPSVLLSIVPNILTQGSPATIDFNGFNFQPGAIVQFTGPQNGQINVNFVSSTKLNVVINSVNLNLGSYSANVKNPDNLVSNSLPFQVVQPANNAPTISGIPDQFVNENAGFINNLVDLHLFASDPETSANQLTYSILSQSNTNILACSLDSNQFIDCQTQLNQNGFSDVTVQVKDPQGLTDTDTFRITVQPQPFTVNIIADKTSGKVPFTVNFDAEVNGGNAPFNFEWDLDGDGSIDSTLKNPTAKFKKIGTFNVFLKVTDADGKIATDSIQIKTDDENLPRRKLYIGQIRYQEEIRAGKDLFVLVNVENQNSRKTGELSITVMIPELGIRDKVGNEQIKRNDIMSRVLVLPIPEYAEPGEYQMLISINDHDTNRKRYRPVKVI